MSSANSERRRHLKRKSSNNLDRQYLLHQPDVLELDYGSPARSRKCPNLSQGRDTEKEETIDDIDEAMRRRRVANEETDEIVESLKKKVETSKEKISSLEAKVKDQAAEIRKLKEKTQEVIDDKERLLLESSKQKTETDALTAARQDLERDLDEANHNLSSAVENGKSLQRKLTAGIARIQELQEENHALVLELEKKEKLLDTLRRSFRAIRAFVNDEPLDS
ncbi:uncharacterized protein Bfra_000213 [Botrytis fragariae]|uniref:Uncharacterized protein n=1 Tax=Botrytis fragariae TaxID=1964551 RepID=A0A8H6B2B9_9HELO|nr:uncharacterized protein Bfra_000213 [Botrytis fragariae]KAF5878046.1 hypothetical protein Bfra_000213 [Botrytis fragariae]